MWRFKFNFRICVFIKEWSILNKNPDIRIQTTYHVVYIPITLKVHPKGIFISDKQGAKNSQQSMDPTT